MKKKSLLTSSKKREACLVEHTFQVFFLSLLRCIRNGTSLTNDNQIQMCKYVLSVSVILTFCVCFRFHVAPSPSFHVLTPSLNLHVLTPCCSTFSKILNYIFETSKLLFLDENVNAFFK